MSASGHRAGRGRGVAGRIPRPRKSLVLLVSLAAAVSVLGTAVFLREAYLEVDSLSRKQFLEQEMAISRQTARSIEGRVAQLVREMQTLAEDPAIRRIDPAGARSAMERAFTFAQGLAVNDISRNDAGGVVRLTLTSPQLVGQDFSFRDYFRRVRTSPRGTPVFEFLTFRGFRKGEKGILIAIPVFDDEGAFAGPLVFILEAGRLLEQTLPSGEAGRRTWVADEDGTVLYHGMLAPGTSLEETPGGDEAWRGFLAAIRQGAERTAGYRATDGREVLAAASPIRIADEAWSVVVEQEAEGVRSNLASFSDKLAAGASIAILALIGAAALLTEETSRGTAVLRREVLERRRIEQDLRRSEHTYRTLVEHSPS